MRSAAFDDIKGDFLVQVLAHSGDVDGVAHDEVGLDDFVGQVVLDVALDGAAERTSAVLRIPAFFDQKIFGAFVDVDAEAHALDAAEQSFELNFDDAMDVFALEAVEIDDGVDTVEELGSERLLSDFSMTSRSMASRSLSRAAVENPTPVPKSLS